MGSHFPAGTATLSQRRCLRFHNVTGQKESCANDALRRYQNVATLLQRRHNV